MPTLTDAFAYLEIWIYNTTLILRYFISPLGVQSHGCNVDVVDMDAVVPVVVDVGVDVDVGVHVSEDFDHCCSCSYIVVVI